MDATNLTIGDVLQELLHRNRLTEAELARRIKVPRQTINRIVSGQTPDPRIPTLKALAKYFDITVGQLLGVEPLEEYQISKDKNVIAKTAQIPILDMQQTLNWEQSTKNAEKTQETILSQVGQFAVRVIGEAMSPIYPEGALLIIDTTIEPKNRDDVLVYVLNEDVVLFRTLICDSHHKYIKAKDKHFPIITLNNNDIIIGVEVESRNLK